MLRPSKIIVKLTTKLNGNQIFLQSVMIHRYSARGGKQSCKDSGVMHRGYCKQGYVG